MVTHPRNWTLKASFAALLVATLVPLAVLTVSWVFWGAREERARQAQEVQAMAELVASQVGQRVAAVHERLAVLARLPAVRAGNRQEVERLFQNLLADAPHLQNLGLVAPDGTMVASAVPLPAGRRVSLRDREWLQRVVRWGEPAVGGFQVGRITGSPNAILAHPILDEQGRLRAVVFAALDLVYASRAVTWAYPGVPLLWAIVDEQGLVLLHSRPEIASGKPLDPLPGMIRGETAVPGTRWHSVVGMPEDMATARVRQAFLRIGLPAGLILLVAAGIGLWIAHNTWRPLRALAAAARRSGQGEAGVAVPVRGAGEVTQVASAFREALDAHERRHGELTTLLEATRVVAASLDLEQSLQAIVHRAAGIAGVPAVRLFLADEDARVLRWRAGVGVPHEAERDFAMPFGQSLSGQVIATGTPLAVPDMRGDPRLYRPQYAGKYGLVSYLGLPVKTGGRVIGALVFHTGAPRVYSQGEISLLSAFADQAAISIENARLHETAVQRARQLATLTNLTQSLVASREAEAVGREVVAAVQALMPNAAARLWDLKGDEPPTFKLLASVGLQEPGGGTVRFRRGEGLAGVAASSRQAVISRDLSRDPRFVNKEWAARERLVSAILFPLLAGDNIHGILAIFTREPHDFTETEVSLFQSLATHAAIAIENARLHETTVRRAEQLAGRTHQLEALRAVGAEITQELDLTTLLGLIVQRAVELTGTVSGTIYLWDEAAEALVPQTWCGLGDWMRDVRFHLGEGVPGTVAQRREGMIVNEYHACAHACPVFLERTRIAAVVAEPLVYHDRLVGVINLNREEPGRPFGEEDRQLLALFAAQAAIAIENARLHETIRQHATALEARVRERTGQLEEALQVKAQFLANMSHELRTPLNAVLGFADLLLGRGPGGLTPKQERYLQQIRGGGGRLLELVTELLELTEAESGPVAFRLDRTDVGDLVGEVVAPLSVAAKAKQVELHVTLDPGLPTVVVDRRKLAQVVHHLVSNAIRFTPAGGRVTLRTQRAGKPEAEEAEITVADTGIGIRAEDLTRIFRGFVQADASDARRYGGAGLGLAVVRRLVEQHGGRVWAESEGEGRGARFIVRLPLLAVPSVPRVLVVEDEAQVMDALSAALESNGYVVDRATTGAEALERLVVTPVGLLVLDIGLPDMDGWEVLKQVRDSARTRDLPVLILTGLESVDPDGVPTLGADEFLAKPVSTRVLVGTVARLLARPGPPVAAVEEKP